MPKTLKSPISNAKLNPNCNIPKSKTDPSGNIVIFWDANKPETTVSEGIAFEKKLFNNVPIKHPEKVTNKINLIDLCFVAN